MRSLFDILPYRLMDMGYQVEKTSIHASMQLFRLNKSLKTSRRPLMHKMLKYEHSSTYIQTWANQTLCRMKYIEIA